jgi:Ca2+-binding RTX toxin-like protein
VTLGNGNNTVVTGTSADTITLGSGANTVTGNLGIDTITFGAHSGVDTVVYNTAAALAVLDSGTFTVPATNAVMNASVFEVVTGLQSGDKLALATGYTSVGGVAADGVFSSTAPQVYTNLGSVVVGANQVEMVRGNYSAATQQFIGSATGSDSLFIYDSNATLAAATAGQAVVLVGYAAANSPTAAFANAQVVITLA